MTNTEKIFDRLYTFEGKQYEFHKKGFPESVQHDIDQICELFEASSANMRRAIVSKVRPSISFLFLGFSSRMAIAAVRKSNDQLLVRGLESLAVENCVFDWRDSTIVLATLYHSASKNGANADEMFRFVASMAVSDRARRLFESFLARTPDKRVCPVFCYRSPLRQTENLPTRTCDQVARARRADNMGGFCQKDVASFGFQLGELAFTLLCSAQDNLASYE